MSREFKKVMDEQVKLVLRSTIHHSEFDVPFINFYDLFIADKVVGLRAK